MTDELPFWKEGRIPSGQTLHKYGLSLQDWLEIFNRQGGKCAICQKDFTGRRANIDHEHVKGWKHMKPEDRKQYVRGLLCYTCNKFALMRGVTTEKLYNAWYYLRNWETRITLPKLQEQSRQMHTRKQRVKR